MYSPLKLVQGHQTRQANNLTDERCILPDMHAHRHLPPGLVKTIRSIRSWQWIAPFDAIIP